MAIAVRQAYPLTSPALWPGRHRDPLEGLYRAALQSLQGLASGTRAAGAQDGRAHARTALRIGAAAIGMLGLALQLATLVAETANIVEAACRFLCYFTFWTNAIAALSLLAPMVAPAGTLGRFFSQPIVRTVIAANLLVVGVVYHFVLSESFEPTWAFQADLWLHYVTPALYLADWFLFVPRARLAWRTAACSVAVPLVYGIWMFGHGAVTQWYPYPFLEVQTLGVAETLLNLVGLFSVFIVTTALLILADRLAHAKSATALAH